MEILMNTNEIDVNSTAVSSTKEIGYISQVDDVGTIVTGVIFLILFIVGVGLNTLTIIVITTSNKLIKVVFMHFIISLCVSDLVSAIISPLFWIRRTVGHDIWPLPNLFCKIIFGGDLVTNYVTALHILVFAILRYLSVQFPRFFMKITIVKTKITIVVLWVVSICCAMIPYMLFYDAKDKPHAYRQTNATDAGWPACTVNVDWYDSYQDYQKVAFPIAFYIPIALIVVMSILIAVLVHIRSSGQINKSQNSSHIAALKRKERQAVMQLGLIVFSFLLGYIPFTVYEFWSVAYTPSPYNFKVAYWFSISEYIIRRFSECLNPIIYNLGSNKVRRETKLYLRKILPTKLGQNIPIDSRSTTAGLSASGTRSLDAAL